MRGYEMSKSDVLARLSRIEGQVRGVQRMVEADRYCLDILTQINSITAATKAVGVGLLSDHARHCVREQYERGDGDAAADELVSAVARFTAR